MKKLLLISLMVSLNQFVNSQSITTNSLQINEFCVGDNFEISYTITGNFNSDNVFTAQISKNNFSTFYKIGSLKSNASGVISATIPDFLEESNNYRIRVVSSNPIVIGSNNGENISIDKIPMQATSINLSPSRCFFEAYEEINFKLLDTMPSLINYYNFEWKFGDDANYNGFQGLNPPPIYYNSLGKKNISCNLTSKGACRDTQNVVTNVEIIGCVVDIDSNAYIDSATHNYTPLPSSIKQVWILPNGQMNIFDASNVTFIIEPGGSLYIKNSASYCKFYLKTASSIKCGGWNDNNAIVKEDGSSADISSYNFIVNCHLIEFNYSNAPKEGIEILEKMGFLDVLDNNSNKISAFVIYPIPASERVTIRWQEEILLPPFTKGEVEVYNVLGERVVSMSVEFNHTLKGVVNSRPGEVEVDVSGLPQGLYYVVVKSGGNTVTKQFAVVR